MSHLSPITFPQEKQRIGMIIFLTLNTRRLLDFVSVVGKGKVTVRIGRRCVRQEKFYATTKYLALTNHHCVLIPTGFIIFRWRNKNYGRA